MTIGCNIWMICLKLNWFFYGLSRMLQFSEFVWTPCYSVFNVFNNFLLIDATDRSKISSDQKHFFIALSLYPLSFFANTPFHIWLSFYIRSTSVWGSTWPRRFLYNSLCGFVWEDRYEGSELRCSSTRGQCLMLRNFPLQIE